MATSSVSSDHHPVFSAGTAWTPHETRAGSEWSDFGPSCSHQQHHQHQHHHQQPHPSSFQSSAQHHRGAAGGNAGSVSRCVEEMGVLFGYMEAALLEEARRRGEPVRGDNPFEEACGLAMDGYGYNFELLLGKMRNVVLGREAAAAAAASVPVTPAVSAAPAPVPLPSYRRSVSTLPTTDDGASTVSFDPSPSPQPQAPPTPSPQPDRRREAEVSAAPSGDVGEDGAFADDDGGYDDYADDDGAAAPAAATPATPVNPYAAYEEYDRECGAGDEASLRRRCDLQRARERAELDDIVAHETADVPPLPRAPLVETVYSRVATCDEGHSLALMAVGKQAGGTGYASHKCNRCATAGLGERIYRCTMCDYDCCETCVIVRTTIPHHPAYDDL